VARIFPASWLRSANRIRAKISGNDHSASIEWAECLQLIAAVLKRSADTQDAIVAVPGDDPDWSWALKAAVDWLATAFRRGANGITFSHGSTIRSLVFDLYRRVARLSPPTDENLPRSVHPYFSAQQILHGAVVELCVLFLFWSSKDPASAIGKAPRDSLANDTELR
jgi:hypothetical protein